MWKLKQLGCSFCQAFPFLTLLQGLLLTAPSRTFSGTWLWVVEATTWELHRPSRSGVLGQWLTEKRS